MRLFTPSRIVFALVSILLLFFIVNILKIILRLSSKQGVSLASKTSAEKIMKERLQTVQQACLKYQSINNKDLSKTVHYSIPHPPTPQYSVLYFQLEKKMVYCPVYKAASTSMLHWLLKMQGVDASTLVKNTRRQISEIARQYYPSLEYPLAEELLKKSKRWMVVRHPFERVLSAYRDKLENSTAGPEHGTHHFYQKYGRKIVAKYRNSSATNQQQRKEPSFEEFVNYLIDTDLALYADDHWIPYYLFCTPCLIDYDFILHFETLQQDIDVLLTSLGEKTGPEWKHSNSRGKSKSELIQSYYGQLSRDTIEKLHKKYLVDFEMFGYSIDNFLKLS